MSSLKENLRFLLDYTSRTNSLRQCSMNSTLLTSPGGIYRLSSPSVSEIPFMLYGYMPSLHA